jgi:G:T-mismatch repair DNA endonuclease (very short patch repair protein)
MFLKLYSLIYNINIQHAENGGEYIISNSKYKADGYCKETNTIIEFHGDFWHGNPKIYNTNQINQVNKKTFGELYNKTIKKEDFIKEQGYNLVVIWERDFDNLINIIKNIQKKWKECKSKI